MLHYDHGVPRLYPPIELRHEPLYIGRVEPGRGLVQDVERVAPLNSLQLRRKPDPLCFAAGELGGRMPQPQLTEANLAHPIERATNMGSSTKNSKASSDDQPSD